VAVGAITFTNAGHDLARSRSEMGALAMLSMAGLGAMQGFGSGIQPRQGGGWDSNFTSSVNREGLD
jgi:hypothetical protein